MVEMEKRPPSSPCDRLNSFSKCGTVKVMTLFSPPHEASILTLHKTYMLT